MGSPAPVLRGRIPPRRASHTAATPFQETRPRRHYGQERGRSAKGRPGTGTARYCTRRDTRRVVPGPKPARSSRPFFEYGCYNCPPNPNVSAGSAPVNNRAASGHATFPGTGRLAAPSSVIRGVRWRTRLCRWRIGFLGHIGRRSGNGGRRMIRRRCGFGRAPGCDHAQCRCDYDCLGASNKPTHGALSYAQGPATDGECIPHHVDCDSHSFRRSRNRTANDAPRRAIIVSP